LGALLDAHWPGPKAMFVTLVSDIAVAFLTDHPTPESAAHVGEADLGRLLSPARLPRRQTTRAAARPAARRAERTGGPAPRPPWRRRGTRRCRSCGRCWARSASWTPRSRRGCRRIRAAALLAALPGVGIINLTQLLAEVGPILDPGDQCGAGRRRVRRSTGDPVLGQGERRVLSQRGEHPGA
jgi:hypothetical protein